MNCGLSAGAVERIRAVFAEFPEVDRAVLYGSRAKGNYKPGSDIDLTLEGRDLDLGLLGRIDAGLDELYLPQRFDLSLLAMINHAELLDHIRRVGVTFYEQQPMRVREDP